MAEDTAGTSQQPTEEKGAVQRGANQKGAAQNGPVQKGAARWSRLRRRGGEQDLSVPVPATTGLVSRLRSRATSALREDPTVAAEGVTPVPPVDVPAEERNFRLLRMNPFSIGFFATVGAIVAIFLFQVVQQVGPIIVMVTVSLFLALGLNPIVEWLNERRLKRGLAVALVAIVAIAILVAAAWAVVPLVIDQATLLSTTLPRQIEDLRRNDQVAQLDSRFQILDKVTEFVTNKDTWGGLFGGLMGTGKLVVNAVFSTVVTTVLTFFFLASLPQIKEVIYQLAPASRRPRARYLANEIFRRIGGYLSGMFMVATAQAVAAFIMMNIVGLGKYALALAFVVALLAFIPLIGSPTSMVIIALLALTTVGWPQALAVIVFFLIYQQLEAYVILPNVMKRSVNVPGAITVLAALIGGTLLGAVGALMAVPMAAILLLLFREVVVPALDRS